MLSTHSADGVWTRLSLIITSLHIPPVGIYMSQLILYSRTCSNYQDFRDHCRILTDFGITISSVNIVFQYPRWFFTLCLFVWSFSGYIVSVPDQFTCKAGNVNSARTPAFTSFSLFVGGLYVYVTFVLPFDWDGMTICWHCGIFILLYR